MRTTFITRFYDAGANGGGGSSQPTLSEIWGGDGTPKPTDLQQAQQQQQQQNPEGQNNNEPAEGVNPDGTLQEGYIKDAEGKVTKDPNFKPAEGGQGDEGDEGTGDEGDNADDNTEDGFSFADVDKLRGVELKVEYPEGMDPLSPEGVYHREKAVEQYAVEQFEEHLRKTDPRGYAYLLHRQAGGSDEDFFAQKSFSLPEYESFKDDKDQQIKLYKQSLISKGLDESIAQMAVDQAIKDNKLFQLADAEYKGAQAKYQKELADLEKANKAAEEAYQNKVNSVNAQLSSSIVEGKGLNLIIPDTDKTPFLNFVRERVRYDQSTGQFALVQTLDAEKVGRQLEALYYQYKNGDLKALIQREAQTQNRKRLGAQINKSKQSAGAGGANENRAGGPTGFVPLGSL
jgi:hypothetical protein